MLVVFGYCGLSLYSMHIHKMFPPKIRTWPVVRPLNGLFIRNTNIIPWCSTELTNASLTKDKLHNKFIAVVMQKL